jgi:RimJ/RimL family protein N-acetyltransferase
MYHHTFCKIDARLVSRITAYAMTGNESSIRVAQSLGMKFDAHVVREGYGGSRYLLTGEQKPAS